MRYVLIAVPLLLFSVERAASQLPPLPECSTVNVATYCLRSPRNDRLAS